MSISSIRGIEEAQLLFVYQEAGFEDSQQSLLDSVITINHEQMTPCLLQEPRSTVGKRSITKPYPEASNTLLLHGPISTAGSHQFSRLGIGAKRSHKSTFSKSTFASMLTRVSAVETASSFDIPSKIRVVIEFEIHKSITHKCKPVSPAILDVEVFSP